MGNSIAIDGATIAAGAGGDDTNANDRGAVYVFRRESVFALESQRAG
jgi:FG-GAP repeat